MGTEPGATMQSPIARITIGKISGRPVSVGSFDTRVVELEPNDPRGKVLDPGQSTWKLESSIIGFIPCVPVLWPVKVTNDNGRFVRRPFGISFDRQTQHT